VHKERRGEIKDNFLLCFQSLLKKSIHQKVGESKGEKRKGNFCEISSMPKNKLKGNPRRGRDTKFFSYSQSS